MLIEKAIPTNDLWFYNGCIGEDPFNPILNGWFPGGGFIPNGLSNSDEPCNISKAHLFKNKTKRFPDIYTSMGVEPGDLEFFTEEDIENLIGNLTGPGVTGSIKDLCGNCEDAVLMQQFLRPLLSLPEGFYNLQGQHPDGGDFYSGGIIPMFGGNDIVNVDISGPISQRHITVLPSNAKDSCHIQILSGPVFPYAAAGNTDDFTNTNSAEYLNPVDTCYSITCMDRIEDGQSDDGDGDGVVDEIRYRAQIEGTLDGELVYMDAIITTSCFYCEDSPPPCEMTDCAFSVVDMLNELIGNQRFSPEQLPIIKSKNKVNKPKCLSRNPFAFYYWVSSWDSNTNVLTGKVRSKAIDSEGCTFSFKLPTDLDPNQFGYITGFKMNEDHMDANGEIRSMTLTVTDVNSVKHEVEMTLDCGLMGICCVESDQGGGGGGQPNASIQRQKPLTKATDKTKKNKNRIFKKRSNITPKNKKSDVVEIGDESIIKQDFWNEITWPNPCERCQQQERESDPSWPEYIRGNTYCCTSPFCSGFDPSPEGELIPDCEDNLEDQAAWLVENLVQDSLERLVMLTKRAYMRKCLEALDTFTIEYENAEHHFTLYYYDQAGNLTSTVPPNGTFDYEANEHITLDAAATAQVQEAREGNGSFPTNPNYSQWATQYKYTSFNQIKEQELPDHGGVDDYGIPVDSISKYFYDKFGRIIFSQNPQQKEDNEYSYTLYDVLSRPHESGKLAFQSSVDFLQQWGTWPLYANYFVNHPDAEKQEIVKTYYDNSWNEGLQLRLPAGIQRNLRNRVSASVTYDDETALNQSSYGSVSLYDYDELGNVQSLLQVLDRSGDYRKLLEYEYDLLSGNVNKLVYQRGMPDQFIYKYDYDSDNRLLSVETSLDNCIFDKDAEYIYYPHGPEARLELGNEQIQGIDRVYTIQGWLKGNNSGALLPEYDPGHDGSSTGIHPQFAPDEVGYLLHYYAYNSDPLNPSTNEFRRDYHSISGNTDFEPEYQATSLHSEDNNLFNGNIPMMATSIGYFIRNNSNYRYMANRYRYDDLNRLVESRPHGTLIGNTWSSININPSSWNTQPYYTHYEYDGNGNLLALQRNCLLYTSDAADE